MANLGPGYAFRPDYPFGAKTSPSDAETIGMQVTALDLDELVTLALRSLRRAPTGLAALLSGTAGALEAQLVAACVIPVAEPPETLASAGPDGPGLSSRTGEDHTMLRALGGEMDAVVVPPAMRSGKWRDYEHVAAVSSCIDENTSCLVMVGSVSQIDLGTLQRASAPVTVLVHLITEERASRELRHRASEADQEISLLLAALHHDLRTPLTGILGSARTLIERDSEVSPEVRHELLESIVRQADRLTRMVSDTLERDRHRDGPVRMVKVRLRDLVERAAAAAMMGRKGTVTVESPDTEICTDADRLERALLNLLDNALKYSPEGAAVYLIAEEEDGWARFTTADNGPGVAHDILPRLFTAYSSDTGRSDGVGLGLNSAKQAIEQDLGGLLSYSRREGWTRFVASVPSDGSTDR